jgi:arginyl-tRNA synthetase
MELDVLKLLAAYPNVIEEATNTRTVANIVTYLGKLATAVHTFYHNCKIIDVNDISMTKSRLALAKACKIVLADGLALIGVEAPDVM